MKMPYRTLAILLLFVGAPFGLMQLTTRAIEIPKTVPLMSTAPNLGFAFYSTVGRSLSKAVINKAVKPNKLPYLAICVSLRDAKPITDLESWHHLIEAQHNARFTSAHRKETIADSTEIYSQRPITGMVSAAHRAMAASWAQWQPTLVALPDGVRELCRQSKRMPWRSQAPPTVVASRPPVASRSPTPLDVLEFASAPLDVLFPRSATSTSTVLISAASNIPMNVWRSIAFPATRLAVRTAEMLPNPLIGVARMADGLPTETGLIGKSGNRIQSSVDNR